MLENSAFSICMLIPADINQTRTPFTRLKTTTKATNTLTSSSPSLHALLE
jgi:hypothetical protein